MRTCTLRLLASAVLAGTLFSCAPGAAPVKVGDWRITYRQDRSLAAITGAREWQPVTIPATFRLPYPPERGFQYVWLRGSFELRGDLSRWFGVTTGRVFYTDRIFINGVLVGELAPDEISMIRQRRNYEIPRGLLREGTNEIHIELGIPGGEYGGITSDVFIRDKRGFHAARLFNDFIYFLLPLEVIGISFIALLILIIYFLWNRNERLYLYSSAGLIVYILFMASLFYPYRFSSLTWIRFLQLASVPLFLIILILIIQSLYGTYLVTYNRVYIPVLLILAGGIFGAGSAFSGVWKPTTLLLDLLAIAIQLAAIPLVIRMSLEINRLKPDLFKFVMVMLIIAAGSVIALFEIGNALVGGRLSLILVTVCSPVFLLIFTIFFARDLMKKNIILDLLYDNLKEPGKREKKSVINESSREKLERVVAFINENFRSDLSREGLAAAVDMNPNYMSGLFKEYTGYRVNDYINKLRIEEAMLLLGDREVRIIEIAFAVGFESLSTFNRAFKNYTGKTPTQFRGE